MAHRALAVVAAFSLAALPAPPSPPDHGGGWTPGGAPVGATSSPETPRTDADSDIVTNDNRRPAGHLDHGVLTVRLEARDGIWYPEGAKGMGLQVAAWAEEGKPLQNPGPLIRVPAGTEIRATVRNALSGRMLTVRGLSDRRSAAPDTCRLAPGEVREVRFMAPA